MASRSGSKPGQALVATHTYPPTQRQDVALSICRWSFDPAGCIRTAARAPRCVTVDWVARVALIGSHSLVLLEDCEKLSRSLTCSTAPVSRRRK